MLPSIFGESLFDDWFDFPFRGFESDVLSPMWTISCTANTQPG